MNQEYIELKKKSLKKIIPARLSIIMWKKDSIVSEKAIVSADIPDYPEEIPERQSYLYDLGKKAAENNWMVTAIIMNSEAFLTTIKNDKKVNDRIDSLATMGLTVDGRTRCIGNKLPTLEEVENFGGDVKTEENILDYFFKGFAKEFIKNKED